uniref:Uncharacterized protein n=1 Tax=Arundo donax TaxID=35708 RepID=A0A0A8YFL8_ARUDO
MLNIVLCNGCPSMLTAFISRACSQLPPLLHGLPQHSVFLLPSTSSHMTLSHAHDLPELHAPESPHSIKNLRKKNKELLIFENFRNRQINIDFESKTSYQKIQNT